MSQYTSTWLNELLRRNKSITVTDPSVKDTWKNAVAKPDPGTGALGKGKTKETDSRRFLVRIVSVRKRLGDPDGLVCKWHLDSLRYAGIISDDTAKVLDLQVSQRKCAKGEEESTEIEVYQLI